MTLDRMPPLRKKGSRIKEDQGNPSPFLPGKDLEQGKLMLETATAEPGGYAQELEIFKEITCKYHGCQEAPQVVTLSSCDKCRPLTEHEQEGGIESHVKEIDPVAQVHGPDQILLSSVILSGRTGPLPPEGSG